MPLMPKGFYVYAYLREKESSNGDKGSPYYVGKGVGRRAWHKVRRVRMPKNPEDIVILVQGMEENEAFAEEFKFIELYGRICNGTGCLHNIRQGGRGLLDPESTKKIREQRAAEKRGQKITKHLASRLREGNKIWWESLSEEDKEHRKENARLGRLNQRHTPESIEKMREVKRLAWEAKNPQKPQPIKVSKPTRIFKNPKSKKNVDNFLNAFYARINMKTTATTRTFTPAAAQHPTRGNHGVHGGRPSLD